MTSPWLILQIAPTTDLRAIKSAYARQLKAIGGSDNLACFQPLNEAYEQALGWAKAQAANTPQQTGQCPIDPEVPPDVVNTPPLADRVLLDADDPVAVPVYVDSADLYQTVPAAAELAFDPESHDDPVILAQALLADLRGLEPESQTGFLWQRPELQSLGLRPLIELALMQQFDAGSLHHLEVLPALRLFFGWARPPLIIEGEREVWLQRWYEGETPVLLVIEVLERLARLPLLVERIEWLYLPPTHQQLSQPIPTAELELALLRQLVAQPAPFASAGWALLDGFDWSPPPAEEVTEKAALLRLLFDRTGRPWKLTFAAAVTDLLAELRAAYDESARRRLIKRDRRLTSQLWGQDFVGHLKPLCAADPQRAEHRALHSFLKNPRIRRKPTLGSAPDTGIAPWLQWILVMLLLRFVAELLS